MAAASALGLVCQAQAAALSKQDQSFANQAAETNLAEISAGHMAMAKSPSQAVGQLAQTMVTDHTQSNQQLSQIAGQQGFTLPSQPSAQQQAQARHLLGLSGKQFDQTFARDQVQDHRTAITTFQKEARSGQDPALKSFAQQTIPVLQKHLQMAETASRG
jgi:putative membrane protein